MARGRASLESVLSCSGMSTISGLASGRKDAEQLLQRIIVAIHDTFFKGNNGVIRDGDVLGADLGAALGDVAVTDAAGGGAVLPRLGFGLFQLRQAVFGIEGVHFEGGGVNEV